MGNVSNIYRRVLASADIHCINLTWPPQRQEAGQWDGRFREAQPGATRVMVRVRAGDRGSGESLICAAVQEVEGAAVCVCVATCMRPQLFVHVCVNAVSCTHAFLLCVCVCVFCLKLRLLFVEWSSGAHSDRWCKLLIAVFPVAECGGPCPPSLFHRFAGLLLFVSSLPLFPSFLWIRPHSGGMVSKAITPLTRSILQLRCRNPSSQWFFCFFWHV